MAYSLKIILFSFALTLLPVLIHAQTDKNQIIILVSDELGSKISDASVVLFDGQNKILEKKTDKKGAVIFQVLTSSKYRVSISAKGFKEYLINDINFDKNSKQSFDVVLEIEPIQVDVSVGETEGFDSDNFGRKTILGKEEIDNLPEDSELLLKRLLELAGVKDKGDIIISVNGVTVTEIPPKARIKQIRINRNVFSAQYEGTSTASIEITTSAFVEKVTGYFSYQFGNSKLNAANPFLGIREPFQQNYFSGGISIPAGKKTSVSIDGRYFSDLLSSTITATVLDSNFSPKLLRKSFLTPKYNERFSIEFDSDRIKNHQIILKQEVNQIRRNGIGVGGLNLQSRSANSTLTRFTTLFSDVYTPNPNFFSQTAFLGNFSKNSSISESSATGINVTGSFFGGSGNINEKQSETKLKVTNDSVRKYGNYTMGFGGQLQWQRITEESKSNFNGTYTFTGKIAPKLDGNNLPVLDNSGNYVSEQISSLESYRRTLVFQQTGLSSAKIRELGGGAEQFAILGGSADLSATQTEYAFYQQNSWGISETFGISFGLRYENQTNINSHLNFSPRVGFIWSPKKKDKRKLIYTLPDIRGGVGIFYSRFDFDNTLNFQRINDSNRFSYIVSDASLLDNFPNQISVTSLQQLSIPKSRLLFDEALQTPRRQIANISISKPLTTKVSMRFDLTITKATRLLIVTNINSPLAQTYNFANRNGGVFPFGTNETILKTQSNGQSNSLRMIVNLNTSKLKLFKKQTFLAIGYFFDKSRSNVVNASSSPFNAYDFQNEYAPDENDGIHTAYFIFNYSLPYWIQINGLFNISSGSRFNIITGQDTNGDGFYSERPAFSNNPNKIGVIKTKYGLLDPNPSASDVLIPRNLGRGALQSNFDVNIYKRIGLNEDKKNKKDYKQILDIGLSVTNALNSNNKGVPIGNMSSPNFLEFIKTFSEGNSKNDSRRITLSASFYF